MKVQIQGLVALSAILMVSACFPAKSYDSEGMEKSCEPYYNYVRGNFKEVKEDIFDFVGTPRYDTSLHIEYQHINIPCITGLKKRQVERVFGPPSLREDTRFHYYFREKCFQKGENRPGCTRMVFYFDSKGRVEKVHLPYLETPPLQ